MPVDIQTKKSKQFRDFSPHIALGSLGLIACAWLVSIFFQKTLVNQVINLSPEESTTLEPIQLEKTPIGALRIDVSAVIPSNRWITYEIVLSDAQGELLASAMKQAWRESGTWVEDGESGTWSEQDLQGGLDIRSPEGETVTIELAVLEYATTAGEALDELAGLTVVVKNGVMDTRYFIVGAIASIVLALLAYFSVSDSGKYVVQKSIGDSDLGGRAVTGGADKLIKTYVLVKSDETSPSRFTVEFLIQDKNGEEVYFDEFNLNRGSKSDDSYSQSLQTFFLLEPRDSYRFYVEVVPDGPVDNTQLTVKEGVRTMGEVDVIHVIAPG